MAEEATSPTPEEKLNKLADTAISTEIPKEFPPDSGPTGPVYLPPQSAENDQSSFNMTQVNETFDLMNHLNEDANNLTRGGNYKLAIEKYKQALKTANVELFADQLDLRAKYRDLRIRIISNVALCCIKLEDYPTAKSACELGLKSEPDHSKMRFRLAVALYNLQDYEESLTQINLALQQEPNNLNIRQQREEIIKAKRAYNQTSMSGLKGKLSPKKDVVVEVQAANTSQTQEDQKSGKSSTKAKEDSGSSGWVLGIAAAVGIMATAGYFFAKKYYKR